MQLLHFFFEDDSEGVMKALIDELKDLNLEDQKMILNLVQRLKNK
jgi:hypothetical protein